MRCPKCTIEIQPTSNMTCPNCATHLVVIPLQDDNAPSADTGNQFRTAIVADTIAHAGTPYTSSDSILTSSQENIFLPEHGINEALGEKCGQDTEDTPLISSASYNTSGMPSFGIQQNTKQRASEQTTTIDPVFRQILDINTAASDTRSGQPPIDSNFSNISARTNQNHSRELLDKAFGEIYADDQRSEGPGTQSLVIAVVLGVFILVCVMGTGVYYMKKKTAHEAIMQAPAKILSLPPSDAPAPTLKRSGSSEEKSQGVNLMMTQNYSRASQVASAPPTAAPDSTYNTPDNTKVQNTQGYKAEPTQSSDAGMPQKNEGISVDTHTTPRSAASSSMNDLTDSGSGSHILLCGSFQDKNKAFSLVKKIKSKGYPAFLEKADLGFKGVWYRIKIAGFTSKDAADQACYDLKQKLKIEAIVAKRR